MPESILIVDDEPGITAALMVRLEAHGYRVHHAINGMAGIEAAMLHRPDVIVLDVRMPDIDGFEVCSRLRAIDELAAIPVIFLTANVQDEARRRATAAGGTAFLSKPYQAADVIDAIERAGAEGSADVGAAPRAAAAAPEDPS